MSTPNYLTSLHVTSSPRQSSSIFAYYKRPKTGGGNVQGTGLICHTMVVVLLIICLLLDRYWYHNGCLFPDMGTVFIAIDKCDRENGCLKVRVGLTQRRLLTPPTIHGTIQHCGHVGHVHFLNLIFDVQQKFVVLS